MSERLTGAVSAAGTLVGSVNSTGRLRGTVQISTMASVERYEGECTFTPSEEAQIIDIQQKLATGNITIEPIPSNYGLITWDGTKLTIS